MRYTILDPGLLAQKRPDKGHEPYKVVVRVKRTSWLRALFRVPADTREVRVRWDLWSHNSQRLPPTFYLDFEDEWDVPLADCTKIPRGLKKAVIHAWKCLAPGAQRAWQPEQSNAIPKAKVVDIGEDS